LKLLGEAFLNDGDEAVMATPSFSEYAFVTQLMGGCSIQVPSLDFRHDLGAMADCISPRTKIIFVCNPNNPTGTIVTRAEVRAFLNRVPEKVVVVFDEAYREYVTARTYPNTLDYIREGRPNVIILRTFSKIYGLAGLRVGYGVAAPQLTGWLMRVREPFNVNQLAQVGALAALKDELHVARTREMNEAVKKYLYQQFAGLGLAYVPTEANFVLVRVARDARDIFKRLLAEGIIVRTGDIFGLPEHIRVTIGTRRQNEKFIAALTRVLVY
jgi:histidinol-phosphate aminotransferase